MSTANDSVSFFILEAGECLECLDANLASAGPGGPDATAFVRYARTLRGAALMHRLTGMAEVAAAVERCGRSLRDGTATWSPAVAAALVAAVDDLKILLHNLRIWGPNEEARAARRLADLARVIPPAEDLATAIGGRDTASSGIAFLARQAMDAASALEALERASAQDRPAGLETALGCVRTLRGVAAVHDVPPVPDVLDAVEREARNLALSRAAPTPTQASLFAAAAALLRRTAADLRAFGRSEPGTPEERRFLTAREALVASAADVDRILPISDLFYGDEQSGVVSRAASPPTTPADRFRLEVVSLAEHLRGLVRDAQSAGPGPVADRTVADLRSALGSVRNAAESFAERDISDVLATFTEGHPVFDFLTLNAIDDLVRLLTEPTATGGALSARMAELARGRALDTGIGRGLRVASEQVPTPPALETVGGASRPVGGTRHDIRPDIRDIRPDIRLDVAPPMGDAPKSTSTPQPEVGRRRVRTPTGPDLQALLADGIAGFSSLGDLPLIDEFTADEGPVAAPSQRAETSAMTPSVVPIESLLYRGESALARARTLRDTLRAAAPTSDALAELYDLLDLAASA